MGDLYILDENNIAVPEPDVLKWAKWKEANRDRIHVGQTVVNGVVVSTVFLGLDHGYGMRTHPVLWETMLFKDNRFSSDGILDENEDYQERYTSHAAAVAGHTRAVDMVLARKVTP